MSKNPLPYIALAFLVSALLISCGSPTYPGGAPLIPPTLPPTPTPDLALLEAAANSQLNQAQTVLQSIESQRREQTAIAVSKTEVAAAAITQDARWAAQTATKRAEAAFATGTARADVLSTEQAQVEKTKVALNIERQRAEIASLATQAAQNDSTRALAMGGFVFASVIFLLVIVAVAGMWFYSILAINAAKQKALADAEESIAWAKARQAEAEAAQQMLAFRGNRHWQYNPDTQRWGELLDAPPAQLESGKPEDEESTDAPPEWNLKKRRESIMPDDYRERWNDTALRFVRASKKYGLTVRELGPSGANCVSDEGWRIITGALVQSGVIVKDNETEWADGWDAASFETRIRSGELVLQIPFRLGADKSLLPPPDVRISGRARQAAEV